MKKLLLFIILLPAILMADAVIFSGNDVKALKQNLDLFGVVKVLSGTVDPSAGAGVAAPQGSAYLSTAHGLFLKTGAANTAWTKNSLLPVDLTSQVTGVLPIANGGTNSSTALTNNKVIVSSSGSLQESATTTTQLGFLDATSSVQTQFNGKVTGPGSSTDNAIARFDLATGKLIQNSGVIIDDSNNVTGINNFTILGDATLKTSFTGPLKATAGVISASAIDLTADVSNILPIANGGTGSATKNFVDTSTVQTGIAGNKTFTGVLSASSLTATGSISTSGGNISAPAGVISGSALISNSGVSAVTLVSTPLVIGGSSTTQSLTLKPTSGAGTTGSDLIFQVGNNGATEAMRILNTGSIGVGTATPNANAILDLSSTTKAFIPPRMSTTQKNAIPSPAVGMIVYDSTLSALNIYNGSVWTTVISTTPTLPTIQKFTSGSGTYTTPANVKYIKIKMVGGGGGGAGGGQAAGTGSGSGGNSTFGTALLVANGGSGGGFAGAGQTGGTASVSAPALALVSLDGGSGQGTSTWGGSGTAAMVGGSGGNSAFGSSGGGGGAGIGPGRSAAANSGSGGGGGYGALGGGGGGAGGYIEALITAPSSTYSYAIGAGGAAGGAGTSGFAGGAGGSGYIVVEEYY